MGTRLAEFNSGARLFLSAWHWSWAHSSSDAKWRSTTAGIYPWKLQTFRAFIKRPQCNFHWSQIGKWIHITSHCQPSGTETKSKSLWQHHAHPSSDFRLVRRQNCKSTGVRNRQMHGCFCVYQHQLKVGSGAWSRWLRQCFFTCNGYFQLAASTECLGEDGTTAGWRNRGGRDGCWSVASASP